MQFLLFALVLFTSTILVSTADMDTVYKWKYVDYVWESEDSKQKAIDAGDYNYTQVMPMDVEKAKDGRIFISMVGRRGVPAVLGTVTDKMGPTGPLIKPYPDWSYYKKGSCDTIQNVYRIAIDECNRLWALDTGFVQEEEPTCEPQLLSFDLKTDSLIQRIKIPKEYAIGTNNLTLLVTPVVETDGSKCENTTVYMADALGNGLVIWDQGKFSRLENPAFGPSEEAMNITSGNFTVEWNAGIVTMAISPSLLPNEPRFLYFHALASFDLYFESTIRLKTSSDGNNMEFGGSKNFLSSQAIGVVFSGEGTLFMGLTKESGIACWNKYTAMKPANFEIVVKDDVRLQYVNGMKVISMPNSKNEELWAVSNRIIAYANKKLNFDDYNFRVLKGSVKKLIEGTECELPAEVKSKLMQDENKNSDSINNEYELLIGEEELDVEGAGIGEGIESGEQEGNGEEMDGMNTEEKGNSVEDWSDGGGCSGEGEWNGEGDIDNDFEEGDE